MLKYTKTAKMVMVIWKFVLIFIFLTEDVKSNSSIRKQRTLPLSKSFGFSIRKDFGKTLDDARADEEYLKLYSEMLMDSQSAASRFQKELHIEDPYLPRNKGRAQRRRAARMHFPEHQRQVRSQAALRREKLNSQSMRSHYQHSRSSQSSSEE